MSEHIYFLTMGLMFGTILLVFGMKYYSAASQARSRAVSEDAYRVLAEKAAAVQSESAASLAAIQGDVAEIKTRLAGVEKILKAVE